MKQYDLSAAPEFNALEFLARLKKSKRSLSKTERDGVVQMLLDNLYKELPEETRNAIAKRKLHVGIDVTGSAQNITVSDIDTELKLITATFNADTKIMYTTANKETIRQVLQ